MSHYELDARNLLCPLPVIRVQDRVRDLSAGDTLEVVCTDPGATHDIPTWCRINGHEVLESRSAERDIFITIRVADD